MTVARTAAVAALLLGLSAAAAGAQERPAATSRESASLDVNQLAEGKEYMALGIVRVSDDDRSLLYSADETGFREYTLRLKDLVTGETLPLALPKVTSAAWAADSRTILYTVEDDAKRSYRLYRHRIGTDVHTLVYEETDERFRVGIGRGRSRRFFYFGITFLFALLSLYADEFFIDQFIANSFPSFHFDEFSRIKKFSDFLTVTHVSKFNNRVFFECNKV